LAEAAAAAEKQTLQGTEPSSHRFTPPVANFATHEETFADGDASDEEGDGSGDGSSADVTYTGGGGAGTGSTGGTDAGGRAARKSTASPSQRTNQQRAKKSSNMVRTKVGFRVRNPNKTVTWRSNAGAQIIRATWVEDESTSYVFKDVINLVEFIGCGRSTIYKKFPKRGRKPFEYVTAHAHPHRTSLVLPLAPRTTVNMAFPQRWNVASHARVNGLGSPCTASEKEFLGLSRFSPCSPLRSPHGLR
jgi:hypothetical protein